MTGRTVFGWQQSAGYSSLSVNLIILGQAAVGNEFEMSTATFDTNRDPPEYTFNVEKECNADATRRIVLCLRNTLWTARPHRFDARGLPSQANVWIPPELGSICSSRRWSLDFDLLGRRKSTEKPILHEAINDTRHDYSGAGGNGVHEFPHLKCCRIGLSPLYPEG